MSDAAKPQPDPSQILNKALSRALQGGISGMAAMAIQVSSLMWLRTTMNYQYRYGTTTTQALKTLYAEGGIPRFYRGILPALIQGPLSRFGDTAANAGVLALMDSMDSTRNLPVGLKTLAASTGAATWRIFLMPVDTLKTTLQVEGAKGMSVLKGKLKTGGIPVLYHGALAASAATLVGHFPWFFTYNYLDEVLPKPETGLQKLGRSALMGFSASVISDTCSNSVRVIKTTKQTSATVISYPEAVKMVIQADGIAGLFGRGLKTRILTNGLQGLLFSVLWRYIDEAVFGHKKSSRSSSE
jgi:hypothetical protein